MDAEDAPLPGYSVPIRAPLTVDSDSEFCLSINAQIYSRTSSFNSTSSIDISSYSDEHTSHFEEENEGFVAYPDQEIVIQRSHVLEVSYFRPFVRYQDANYVKERYNVSESIIFRPFVKISCEESSSVDVGTKLSVPVAPLTGDCDGDSDSDGEIGSVDPADGVVQKVAMDLKVRSFSGDEEDDELRVEGVFSGDDNHDVIGIENLDSVSTESVENEGCEVECWNDVVKDDNADASSFGFERIDELMVLSSNNDIEIGVISMKLSEPDEPIFDSDVINTQIVSSSDSEIENLSFVSTESVEIEGCEVECLIEAVKVSEWDVSSFDLERVEARAISDSNNEIEIETVSEKVLESDEPSFDSERIDAQNVSSSESEQEVVCEKEEEMLTKMQRIRARFLRLALIEQLTKKVNGEGGNYKFDFDLTVLAIGKTGVGKSATINSIFGENKVITSAYDPGTTTIQEITGNIDGIQLRVIDTPGLKCSSSDQSYNLRILKSIKRFTRKHTPNVVLYVDRLDTRDVNDSHLLKLITSSLGSSVWHSCIIALTHASCDPSSGFVVHRCRFIQEQIVSCGGNDRHMANPVWLVDNHPSCKHDVMDLDCRLKGLKGLACLDQANEDDGCDQVPPFEPSSEAQGVNHSLERKKAYFTEHGYRVKLVGTNHWSLGCRLCI
ncbi:hypothetical protein L1987_73839 [Smallanthus sonchifolius]|uniref:Uncharacterized protein n=1 Tax=Smallanthus sonchifolius TaxID=185202 RepID=A0ACB9A1E0_9ASTR|nr:hypothetical protein L1987_73839 [Smallanthus sonchifolius]